MKKPLHILMVGSATSVKGGMTTVVQSFLQHKFSPHIKLGYIPTHSEKGKIYNAYFFFRSLIHIWFYLLFKNPQIVHLHMSERGSFVRKYIVFKLSKAYGKKVFVHTHGAEFKEYYLAAKPRLKSRILELLKNADKVIALGESWEKTLKDIEPEADTIILMNSIPIPQFQKPVKVDEVFHVLFLAVLIERKGILDLIYASVPVIEQAAQEGKTVIFHIAGDGELMDRAKSLVSSYAIADNYRFHGWVDTKQKMRLLEQTDLFVLPSYNEGLPMSILEALSFGMPVISTDVGSISEAVLNEVNGYLIAPGDITALTESMNKVISSDSFKVMGDSSRKLAEEKFNDAKYFQQVEKLYLSELP